MAAATVLWSGTGRRHRPGPSDDWTRRGEVGLMALAALDGTTIIFLNALRTDPAPALFGFVGMSVALPVTVRIAHRGPALFGIVGMSVALPGTVRIAHRGPALFGIVGMSVALPGTVRIAHRGPARFGFDVERLVAESELTEAALATA